MEQKKAQRGKEKSLYSTISKKEIGLQAQREPMAFAIGSRLKRLRLAAAHSLCSHVCEPKGIFSDAHVTGENDYNFICACGRKLCEASLTI